VCGDCGFIEEWIDAPEHREKIKKMYGKIYGKTKP
jgi:hypothetical protein